MDNVSESLRQYLREQQVYRLVNEYEEGKACVVLGYGDPHISVTIYEQMMEIFYYEEDNTRRQYYFAEPLDWSYLYQMLSSRE